MGIRLGISPAKAGTPCRGTAPLMRHANSRGRQVCWNDHVSRRISSKAVFARRPLHCPLNRSGAEQLLILQRVDGLDLAHDFIWIEAHYLGQVEKLNEVQTAIAIFDVRDKRLVTIESFGDGCLRQSRLLSLLCEQLCKAPMTIRMQSLGHPPVEQISLRRCGNPNLILSKNRIFWRHKLK